VPDERGPADVYHVEGPGIEITYRRQNGRLEVAGDDSLLARADHVSLAAVGTEFGLLVTATLLPSDRGGTRHMLVMLLPEVHRAPESVGGSHPVTGLAIRTTARLGGTSVPVGAVQQYSDAIRVEGTASFS
jgi:hypothetical protein